MRLAYLPFRAMAETTRMMLRHAKIEFQDEMIWGQAFALARHQLEYPFDKVPVLYVSKGEGSVTIAQSGSIARYAAKLAGCYPKDPVECAFNDAVFEMAQELCTINPLINCYVGEQHARVKQWYFETCLPPALVNLERQLVIADGPFFGGAEPSHADFNVFHHLDNACFVEPACVSSVSTELTNWMIRMLDVQGVKEWLSERPKLEGVGVDPRLTDKLGRSIRQTDHESCATLVNGKFIFPSSRG